MLNFLNVERLYREMVGTTDTAKDLVVKYDIDWYEADSVITTAINHGLRRCRMCDTWVWDLELSERGACNDCEKYLKD